MAHDYQKFYLDPVLIRFQVSKLKRAPDRDRLEGRQSVSTYDRCPYLCGVTGPEQPMLIGTDRPENWSLQAGGGPNGNLTHTECVNQEIVLDLVDVPRAVLGLQRRSLLSWNRTRNPPSDRLAQRRGALSRYNEFWKRVQQRGSRRGGRGITGLLHRSPAAVVLVLCTH